MRPLHQVSYNLIPAPYDGVSYVFQNFMYIFDCFKFKNIGNNGPFPLLMYCAQPIASFDLIECIYCLNDIFPHKLGKSLIQTAIRLTRNEVEENYVLWCVMIIFKSPCRVTGMHNYPKLLMIFCRDFDICYINLHRIENFVELIISLNWWWQVGFSIVWENIYFTVGTRQCWVAGMRDKKDCD